MRAPGGGFYCSLDADSEGDEGRFYVWDVQQVRQLLPPAQFAPFAPRFGLDREPNFEGRWHLHAWRPLDEIARELHLSEPAVAADIEAARGTLLAARDLRVRPARDDKVLVSWNALVIRGLALAARALARPDLAQAATQALEFIHTHMWREGRLLATALGEEAHLDAYLDDYAYLLGCHPGTAAGARAQRRAAICRRTGAGTDGSLPRRAQAAASSRPMITSS